VEAASQSQAGGALNGFDSLDFTGAETDKSYAEMPRVRILRRKGPTGWAITAVDVYVAAID
jgi:hypothetical protein